MHFEGISLLCLLFPSGEESLRYHLLRGGMGQELETWKLGLLRDVSLHPTGKVLLPLQALYLSSLFFFFVCVNTFQKPGGITAAHSLMLSMQVNLSSKFLGRLFLTQPF